MSAALLGALALPVASATTAVAAPVSAPVSAPSVTPSERPCERPGPWIVDAKAVTIRSKASATSTALGILYRGHKFSVHKTSGKWRYVTDKTTGVSGWASAKYVYRAPRLCLD